MSEGTEKADTYWFISVIFPLQGVSPPLELIVQALNYSLKTVSD